MNLIQPVDIFRFERTNNLLDWTAAECLALLFQFPLRIIPGLDVRGEGRGKAEREQDWKSSISALEILYARPNLLSKILTIWERFNEETYDRVSRCVTNTLTFTIRILTHLQACCSVSSSTGMRRRSPMPIRCLNYGSAEVCPYLTRRWTIESQVKWQSPHQNFLAQTHHWYNLRRRGRNSGSALLLACGLSR